MKDCINPLISNKNKSSSLDGITGTNTPASFNSLIFCFTSGESSTGSGFIGRIQELFVKRMCLLSTGRTYTVHANKENTNIRCFSRLSIPIYIFTKIKTEIRLFCTHYPLLLSKINKKLFYIFNRLLNSRSQIRITRTCRTTKINNLSFSVYQDIIWHIMHIPLVTNLLIIFFCRKTIVFL